MAKPTAELLSELSTQSQADDREPDLILELAQKILSNGDAGPALESVQRCEIVALTHLNRFEEALQKIKLLPADVAATISMEHGYCLYKMDRFDEAMAVAEAAPKTEAILQLQAQVLYRTGDFEGALHGFKAVKEVLDDDADSQELDSNMVAAYAMGKNHDAQTKEDFEALGAEVVQEGSSFEVMFNVACGYIEQGRLEDAMKCLVQTKAVCEDALAEDDLDLEEIADECAPINVQLAFTMQKHSNNDEAMALYQEVISNAPSDAQVLTVAHNNIVAIKGAKDLFESIKRTKGASTEVTQKKLTERQKKAVLFNRALLLLHMSKLDQCQQCLQVLDKDFPGDPLTGLLRAALLTKQHPTKAEAAIQDAIQSQDGDKALRLQLSLAQLQIGSGNVKSAVESLHAIKSLQHTPGMVASLTSLHQAEHDTPAAIAVVEQAIANCSTTPRHTQELTLREGAKFLLGHQQYEKAAAAFDTLLKIKPGDPEAVAGLVTSYAQFDPEAAEKYSESIPDLEAADSIDAEALEAETVEQANRGARRREKDDDDEDPESRAALAAEAAAKEALAAKRRAVRQEKRKATLDKRLPKDLKGTDPSTWPALDAERWLPKRDRSYYKVRRSQKKNLGKYGGSQGSALVAADNKYDRSEEAEARKQEEEKQKEKEEPASPPPKQQQQQKQKSKRPKR